MAPESLRRVRRLLLRGLNWIGDAAMSLPTLWNIREALPDIHLSVLAPGWSAGLYEICPAVDEVILTPPKGLLSEITAARNLARGNFDAAFILPNSFRSAVAPALARIPERWGYATDHRGGLLSRAVRLPSRAASEHTVLYYRELLAEAGIEWRGERFDIELSDRTLQEAEEIIKRNGGGRETLRVGFSPGAAWGPSKRWPADRFASVARRLIESNGIEALIFGSDADTELVGKIVAEAGDRAVGLAGAFPELRHLAAAVSGCSLLFTNDSGPMHIAAALGVPVLALFGPTDERRSGPWGPAKRAVVIARAPHCRPCYNPDCTEPGHPCMEEISVDEVISSAERMLGDEG